VPAPESLAHVSAFVLTTRFSCFFPFCQFAYSLCFPLPLPGLWLGEFPFFRLWAPVRFRSGFRVFWRSSGRLFFLFCPFPAPPINCTVRPHMIFGLTICRHQSFFFLFGRRPVPSLKVFFGAPRLSLLDPRSCTPLTPRLPADFFFFFVRATPAVWLPAPPPLRLPFLGHLRLEIGRVSFACSSLVAGIFFCAVARVRLPGRTSSFPF